MRAIRYRAAMTDRLVLLHRWLLKEIPKKTKEMIQWLKVLPAFQRTKVQLPTPKLVAYSCL